MTILEGLQKLPDGIRERAIEEYHRQDWIMARHNPIVLNVYKALECAFNWPDTKEGGDYWFDIYEKLSNNEPVGITPDPHFTLDDLISFGNYLLSDTRRQLIADRRAEADGANLADANEVTDADVANWKETIKTA